jgi:NAD(P)-dependent dehydrogenase (short-subunit alcohol dehydrogenase family)
MNSKKYVNDLFNLSNRIGIITGASRGLGNGIAKVLTDAGAKVYNLDLVDRTEEHSIEGKMIDVNIDITNYDEVEKTISNIIKKDGQLDFLVNNAGITHKSRAESFSIDKYRKIQKINLEAVFKLCQLSYPYLKISEHIGRIVSISSMAAHKGFSGVLPYDITKSGILGLTRGLAEDWKKENILVNSVAPGWILTKINEEMFKEDKERKNAALQEITLDRFGKPTEIGYMILFLLSNASNYITGQDFAVDGGALTHGY